MAVSHRLLYKVPSKLEIQCKEGVYFSFNFGWYSIPLDIVCYEQRLGVFTYWKKSVKRDKSFCRWPHISKNIDEITPNLIIYFEWLMSYSPSHHVL